MVGEPSCTCWVRSFLHSSIGKKSVMAVTGLALLGFVIGHLAGNLQVFLRDDGRKLNEYAAFLKASPGLLWGTRAALLLIVLTHIFTAIRLTLENRAARPVGYRARNWREASYASRTMMMSGPLIALYVVYHLLHFTVGSAHPRFSHTDVYRNLVIGFSSVPVSLVYTAAMLALGLHLYHGFWSACQTFGLSHPKYSATLRGASALLAGAIAAGYISIPAAVLMGILK
jgi:succinate dehydrogenase / fumarate reductase cytochrome b subunit